VPHVTPVVTLSKSSETKTGNSSGRSNGRPAPVAVWGRVLGKIVLRTLPVVLIGLTVALNYRLWLSDTHGLPKVRLLQTALQEQQDENAQLAERNQALAAEVRSLKEGDEAIEELARTELGMIRKDETFFRVLESPPPALSVTRE